MKNYLAEMVDLQGDSYLNPAWPGHNRANSSITHIAVHHDAAVRPHEYDSVQRYRNEAREHYNRLGPGLQYHYKIDNAGGIFKIRPHSMYLYAVGSNLNFNTINICLDGYFHAPHNQKPTREQYEALIQLLNKLTNQTPEIPANGSTVRPHSFFSGTACCGDTLRPFVNQWQASGGVNETIPSDAVYDWPEWQPKPPAPTPTPTPPADTRPDWEKNFEPIDKLMWSEGTATVIDVADNNKTLTTVEDNKQLEIGGKTKIGGTDFFITKYWVSRKVYNKVIPAGQLKDTPDPIPVPEPPVVVPPAQQDHTEARLSALEKLVKSITDFLDKIFKNWRS